MPWTKLLFISSLAWASAAQAQQYLLRDFVSDREFCLDPQGRAHPQAGTLLAVVSDQSRELLGYGIALAQADSEDCPVQVLVKTHVPGVLMRPGNWVFSMDVTHADKDIPGNFELMVVDDAKASVRYKPMVYLGPVLGQAAAVLAPREFIVGFGILGVSPRAGLQVDTTTYMNFALVPNAGVKARLYNDEEYTASVYAKSYYYLLKSKSSLDVEFALDNYSGSRTASHTKVTVKTQRPTRGLLNEEKSDEKLTLHLESFYSFMLPGWDRIQIGPRLNVTESYLGGYLGYAVMWEHFHIILGVQTENVLKPKFVLNTDFFWRF